MKSLASLPAKMLKGKRVLVRLDLSVPIVDGRITDSFRLERALPTIKYLRNAGAKTILLSHLGRSGDSLKPVALEFNKLFDVGFIPAPIERVPGLIRDSKEGSIVLLENLRRHRGEEGSSKQFAKQLASLGDLYVNDAFSVCHRAHASVTLLPKLLPHYAGLELVTEVQELSRAFKPKRPFILVLGGAKFETKVPVLKRFIHLADRIYIVGALAHAFYRSYGYELGRSLIDKQVSAKNYMSAVKRGKIILPTDALVSNGSSVDIKKVTELSSVDSIVDSGPVSSAALAQGLKGAKMILWNGPAGNFEHGYAEGTLAIARAIAKSRAHSIVGGGDTLSAISKLKNADKYSFISTGGGALLEFLGKGTLPGIEALDK